MERQAILVKGVGFPRHIVEEIQTRPRTITVCPVCKKRFKRDDTTVVVDLIKRIPLTEKDKEPKITIRIQICEPCAQPVIQDRNKAMDRLIKYLAELAVERYRDERGKRAK